MQTPLQGDQAGCYSLQIKYLEQEKLENFPRFLANMRQKMDEADRDNKAAINELLQHMGAAGSGLTGECISPALCTAMLGFRVWNHTCMHVSCMHAMHEALMHHCGLSAVACNKRLCLHAGANQGEADLRSLVQASAARAESRADGLVAARVIKPFSLQCLIAGRLLQHYPSEG